MADAKTMMRCDKITRMRKFEESGWKFFDIYSTKKGVKIKNGFCARNANLNLQIKMPTIEMLFKELDEFQIRFDLKMAELAELTEHEIAVKLSSQIDK